MCKGKITKRSQKLFNTQTDSFEVVQFGEGLPGHIPGPRGKARLHNKLGQVERRVEGSGLNVSVNLTGIVDVNGPHIQLPEQSSIKVWDPLREENRKGRFSF